MDSYAVRVGWIYQSRSKIIKDGLLVWSGETIEYIGSYSKDQVPRGSISFHYPKAILTAPFINSHTHLPETLIRGLADDLPLETWLFDHVWKVEPQMQPEDAKIGTLLGIAEMISSGTIGFVDQFYYADKIAEMVAETGVKAFLAPSIFPDNPETGTQEAAYQQAQRVFDQWNGYDGRIKIGYGPHSLYSVDLELFGKIGQKTKDQSTLIHTHVQESKTEYNNALNEFGVTSIAKLAEMDLLDHTLAAHAVHTTPEDVNLLSENNTTVLHNIQSNLKLASGIAPVPTYLDHGINVVLGTDGSASNNNLSILEEIRLVSLIHKGVNLDANLINSYQALQLATINNQNIFGDVYTGQLVEGQYCDFTIFDLSQSATTPIIHPLSNLIYAASSNDCLMTVANGKILFHEGEFKTLNVDQIKHEAQSITDRMIADADYNLIQ